METIIVDQNAVDLVVDVLKAGGVVSFPTETVFGLAVLMRNEQDYLKLVHLKKRPENKPISIMVKDVHMIEELAELTDLDYKLIENFMPGELTAVFKKKSTVSDEITLAQDTVGIRIPDHQFVLALLNKLDLPLLVTSANEAGQDASTTFQEVVEVFDGKIDVIVEGETTSKVASTVVKIENNEVVVLRQGKISKQEIEEVIKK